MAALPSPNHLGAYLKGIHLSQEIAFVVVPSCPIMNMVGIDGVCGLLAFGYHFIDQSIEGLCLAIASRLCIQV